MKFKTGDRVASVAIGVRLAFEGIIAAKIDDCIIDRGGRKINIGGYYHVRDESGKLWHRVESELVACIS